MTSELKKVGEDFAEGRLSIGYAEPALARTISVTRSSNRVEDWSLDIESPAVRRSLKPEELQLHASLPITLKFENVECKVLLNPQTSWWDTKKWGQKLKHTVPEKTVLHGVSGVVHPGEMLAMLGPSGSGKTTLLSILGGRSKGIVSGSVRYNEMPYTKELKRRTGFVTQDDVLFAHLTVKETLEFAALLRLPRTLSRSEKIKRAHEIIEELGLIKCENTIIGGPFLRGVSGGERKRVSIGHEMLVDPSLLLLDEPTSGLDSTTALKIIYILQNLAQSGRTVITTIHQPSSIVFHLFNKIILLCEGNTLYYGKGSEAMNYFASVGFTPKFATNPADFLLDLANGVTHDLDQLGVSTFDDIDLKVQKSVDHKPKEGLAVNLPGMKTGFKNEEISVDIRQVLKESFEMRLKGQLEYELSLGTHMKDDHIKVYNENRKWPTTWGQQMTIVMRRSLKERRHEAFSGLKIIQIMAVTIIVGLLWWHSSVSQVQDQVGLIFFFSTFWSFFPLFAAIFTFPQERKMLLKERASGMYRLSAYFFARTVGDLPLELILPSVFMIIVYWMSGLKATVGAFFLTWLILLFNVLVSQGLGLAIGAALMNVQQATTVASVLMLVFLLAGGFYVQHMPMWIGWIKYASLSYYNYKLQLNVQYSKGQTYSCSTGTCFIDDYPAVHSIGLGENGISTMALVIMMFGYRIIAYIFLRRMKPGL